MCGKVKFVDGHTEDVWTFVKHDWDHITFVTESGTYHYVSYLKAIDVPYEISITGMLVHRVYEFYKDVGDEKVLVFDIQHFDLDERLIGRE